MKCALADCCPSFGLVQLRVQAYAQTVIRLRALLADLRDMLEVFRSCGEHVYQREGCVACGANSLLVNGILSALEQRAR